MKRKDLLIAGAAIGELLGLLAGYAIAARMEEIERQGRRARLRAHPGDWLKLAMSIISVVRQFSRFLAPP